MNRRNFLKLAGATGLAFALPPGIRAWAAEQAAASRQLVNEVGLARLASAECGRSLSFAFMSDTHVPFDDRGIMKKIVAECNARDLDMVLHGGDGVQVGNPNSFNSFLKYIRNFKAPFIMAPGNHDTAFSDYSDITEWTARFGVPFFHFDVAHARFLILNNANYDLGDEQWGFFEKALMTDRPVFIAMHRPVAGLNPEYTTPLKDSDRFRALVKKRGAVRIFNGHEHHYGRYKADGAVYITSGGAGGRLNTNTSDNFHHFMHIRVDGDRIEEEIVKV